MVYTYMCMLVLTLAIDWDFKVHGYRSEMHAGMLVRCMYV